MGKRREILFAKNCVVCNEEFVYCLKSGRDFRCYKCKENSMTVEEVEKELSEMSAEEYQSFMDDIKEYENELEEKRKAGLVGKEDSQWNDE